jgi:hypothetical protein
LQSQDFHLLSTTGSVDLDGIRARKTQARDTSQPKQLGDSAATLFRFVCALNDEAFSARAEAEDGQN